VAFTDAQMRALAAWQDSQGLSPVRAFLPPHRFVRFVSPVRGGLTMAIPLCRPPDPMGR